MLTVTGMRWPASVISASATARRTRSAICITPCPRQDDEELLAAITQEHVPLSQDLPCRTHDGLQHPVADKVSVGVIDGLEVVEVEHQQAQGFAGPTRAAELLRQALQAEPPVVDTCQRVH